MWILPLLGYLGLVLGFLFLTLAIASGLYYLSEIVEEHTVIAKKVLTRMIYAVIAIQLLLLAVDRFPFLLCALSIASHVVYLQNLRRFPIVKLTDPIFLASCALVLLNHWLWFRHFSRTPTRSPSDMRYNYYDPPTGPTFTEIASFFGLNVWLTPFALFVSLSAGENVLPSMGSEYATGQGSSFISPGREPAAGGDAFRASHKRSPTQTGMAKAAVQRVQEFVGDTGELMGFWKGERARPTRYD
ncbi:transmembrane adaptor Erv26 [Neohortaea acidophila]|uniref:Transmembrane adaptor Erv26 n=1 Tax=Neohortaea acidophila TaxID=245834 RepID=A0A6A6PLK0_9PEZI|nr:transmembrane adaptor Erv26 [Neohortaea acidophila]KAF2480571.1 transmembrane adaptor Erv26 [Neohortaea acidophila]